MELFADNYGVLRSTGVKVAHREIYRAAVTSTQYSVMAFLRLPIDPTIFAQPLKSQNVIR